MKSFIAICWLIAILAVGCGGLGNRNQGITGASSKAEDKQKTKVEQIDKSLNKNNDAKLDVIGEFSWGTDYALNKDTNPSPSSIVAKDLNLRIQSLANQPTIDKIKEIQSLVDMLLTNNANAARMLKQKDSDISDLQNEQKILLSQKESEIQKYMKLAEATAGKADQYKATLGEMDSFLGLGAVWYGLKKFFISSMWILGIGSILFLVLRFASMSNPFAAGIFAIFNHIGSWFVHMISALVPKAVELAGNVSSKLFNTYKTTMTKLVDAIQMAKVTAEKTGKEATLSDVLDMVEKDMNDDEKAVIKELKKALNWRV